MESTEKVKGLASCFPSIEKGPGITLRRSLEESMHSPGAFQ